MQRFVKSTVDENSYKRELYVTLYAIEDLKRSVPEKRFSEFLDWGFCSMEDGESAKYLPLTDAVGPGFQSTDFGGKIPNAYATCFDSLESFYKIAEEGGQGNKCWRRSIRLLVTRGFVEYDRFMSLAARFDPEKIRTALRLLDYDEEYFLVYMRMTGLLEGLDSATQG